MSKLGRGLGPDFRGQVKDKKKYVFMMETAVESQVSPHPYIKKRNLADGALFFTLTLSCQLKNCRTFI